MILPHISWPWDFFVSSVAQLEAEISEYFMRVVYIWTLVISCTNWDISAKTPTRIATRISTTIKIDMNGGYQGSWKKWMRVRIEQCVLNCNMTLPIPSRLMSFDTSRQKLGLLIIFIFWSRTNIRDTGFKLD